MSPSLRFFVGKLLQPLVVRAFRRILRIKFFRRQLFDSTLDSYLTVTTVDGSSFILSTRDQVIGRGMFESKQAWDINLLKRAMQTLPNSAGLCTLIDVGANLGSISIGAVHSGLFKRAFAFEPDPNNFRILSANVVLNEVQDKVSISQLALTNDVGQDLVLELSSMNLGDHRIRSDLPVSLILENLSEEGVRSTIKVSSSTLDTELPRLLGEGLRFPALLFMDTQGWEGHILKGGTDFLTQNRQQGGALIIEFWPYGLSRAGGLEFLRETLLRAGYGSVVDLSETYNHVRLDEQALDNLLLKYGRGTEATDLLIY